MSDTPTPPIQAHQLPRARPVILTFYDCLQTYPYTSTFHVHDAATDAQITALITAIRALSLCVLGKYKIAHHEYLLPDFEENIKHVSVHAMGTFRWHIKYHTEQGFSRSNTIPGWSNELSLGHQTPGLQDRAKLPNLKDSRWQTFLTQFKAICVSKEGLAPFGEIEVARTAENWPPKGAKKRR